MASKLNCIFKIFIFICSLSLVLTQGCSKKEEVVHSPPEVKFIRAIQKDIPIVKEWVGQTVGAEDIEVRARVDGYILKIHFAEGTYVSKGSLLYTIDAKELVQAVADAKGRLSAAETMLTQAESDVKRYTPLAESGAVSQRTLEIAIANNEARKGDVQSALASYRLSKINLGYTRVIAQVSGIIGFSNYKAGDFVGKMGSKPLNTISNVDPIDVRFSISEQEYLWLVKKLTNYNKTAEEKKESSPIEMILADGSVYPYKGRVNVANRQIDPSTGTMMLQGSFQNPDRIIRPGQYAKIRTVVDVVENAVIVPSKCLLELQGLFQAYVVGDDNKVQLRLVKTGEKYGEFVIIESGIKPNEKVVTEGILKIKPDIMVKGIDVSAGLDSILNRGKE